MADQDSRPQSEDPWGVGQLADGSINVMTPEQAAIAKGERDAYDEAFGDTAEPGGDEDMELDLDSMSVEELDSLIEGLDAGADAE